MDEMRIVMLGKTGVGKSSLANTILGENVFKVGHTLISETTMRIVILGKTCSGKSSLANTILGENVFQIGVSGNSATRECQSETRRVDGRKITLIDTPGLFDTDRPEEEMKAEIVRCITECSPGPHAFIIVFKVETFTKQENEVINTINQYFSEEAFKYVTLLFTRGDQLQEGQTIKEYFHNNQLVRDLMKKCGGRCHVIDNKYWENNQQDEYRSNRFQVKQLLKTIDHMMKENKGSCLTNKMLQVAAKLRQEEEEKIRQSPGNMTDKEIREESKRRASGRLFINLTGIASGALLACLFNSGLVVKGAINVLKKMASGKQVSAALSVALGEATEAAGKAAGPLMVAGVVGSAIKGGVTGYNAAQEADTAGEAIMQTVKAVFENQ